MFRDYIINGQPSGDVADAFASCQYDPGLLRPWVGRDGKKYVAVNSGKTDENGKPVREARLMNDVMFNDGIAIPVANATSLRKDEWIQLDRVVVREARQRLRAWSDLASRNSFGGFNGMSKVTLEHETMSDPGEAIMDMDGLTPGRTDQPKFQLEGLPLPITHSDFWFSSRRLAVSRNTGTPLDMTMAEAAGRRVAEMIEKLLIGAETFGTAAVDASSLYGTGLGKIWGYTNHPDRTTKTDVTTPTGSNPDSTVADVLAMIKLANDNYFYGPFMLYHSTDWSQYMDNDYFVGTSGVAPNQTLRERLRKIDGIVDVRRLDFLTDTYTLLLVQMTSDVARAVNGMDITTVQWESQGGMRVNFKVMAIQVPQVRSNYSNKTGIVHGTTS